MQIAKSVYASLKNPEDRRRRFDLSGGDIRLVVEKAVRHAAFNRESLLSRGMLQMFAEEEVSASRKNGQNQGSIGFRNPTSDYTATHS